MAGLLALQLLHIEGVPAVAHGGVGAGGIGVQLVVGVELAEPVEPTRGVGAVLGPIGVAPLAASQAGDFPEELAGVVIGLHVLIAVIHQQVGVAGLDVCGHLRPGHAALFCAAGIQATCWSRRLGWLLTEGDGPGGLLIEDRIPLIAAAYCGM